VGHDLASDGSRLKLRQGIGNSFEGDGFDQQGPNVAVDDQLRESSPMVLNRPRPAAPAT